MENMGVRMLSEIPPIRPKKYVCYYIRHTYVTVLFVTKSTLLFIVQYNNVDDFHLR